jgi:uncharacterized protein (DUF2249 family)
MPLPSDASQPIDLRVLLARGADPLALVVDRAKALAAGGVLLLDAPFDPLPLRHLLGRMGVSSRAERLAEGHWRVRVCRDGEGPAIDTGTVERCSGPADPGAPAYRDDGGVHIDVRGLPPPVPMLAILRLVARADPSARIIVHHDRDPLYLYPELAELGWSIERLTDDAGELRFLVRRMESDNGGESGR